ncbi:MAG: hypothetical protein H7Y07_05330, partial [Pyrinomonadaceae bacterium]|nr:hypothetical protein [Sphingobacteriaceae bacterium]
MSDTSFSLHPAQQEVYTDQLLNTNSPLYNIGGYIILKGALDKASFNKAINSAPALLDFFKLRFNLIEPDFRCHYDEGYSTFELSEHDFSHEVNPEESARAWTQERFNTAFTLTKSDLPFEQYLLKISETEHWFYGKYHHLITDGYGFIVWIQYIASKYHSLTSGQEIEFKYPLYRDEAIKANQYLSSSAYEEDAAYWKEKISSKPEKLLQKKYQSQGRADNATSLFNLELPDDKRQLIEELQRDTKSS